MPVAAGNEVDTSLDGIYLGWHPEGILEGISCWGCLVGGSSLLKLGELRLKST